MKATVIWNIEHPADGSEPEVTQGAKKGLPYPILEEEPQLNSPGEDHFDPETFVHIARKPGLSKT